MIKTTITALAASTILASSAMAGDSVSDKADKVMHKAKDVVAGTSIKNIGESGDVTISGKVTFIDTVDSEFTMEDGTGEIDVEVTQDLTVSIGDEVVVSGVVTDDLGEKEIAASKVTITKEAVKTEEHSSVSH